VSLALHHHRQEEAQGHSVLHWSKWSRHYVGWNS